MHAHRSPLRLPLAVALLFAATIPAVAAPYWVAYEGEDFPENQGWVRNYGNEIGPGVGGAERSLENGILTIDSLRNGWVYDFYRRDLVVDPGPGETFVAEWRVRVDPRSNAHDVGVGIMRASSPGYAYFNLGPDTIEILPGALTVSLEPSSYHTFRFESGDMRTFSLCIDSTITVCGPFEDFTINQASIGFGDTVQGEMSLSKWDYFRYGLVTPEPPSVLGALCVVAILAARRIARPDMMAP